jgi:hypothetical protein
MKDYACWCSFDEDVMESRAIENIKYAKNLYETQVHIVKKEEYIKGLLLDDYVNKIKGFQTKYDFVTIFGKAQEEVGKKLKRDRPHLETIQSFIREDFFNGDSKFKVSKIISLGYEGYGWEIELTGYGKRVYIIIPVKSRLTSENIEYAYDGMFAFGVYESEHSSKILIRGYKINEVSDFIKKWREGEVKNESDESI